MHTKNDASREVKVAEDIDSSVTECRVHNTLIEPEEVLGNCKGTRVGKVEARHKYSGVTSKVLLEVHASLAKVDIKIIG